MVVQWLIHKPKKFQNLQMRMGICLHKCMIVLKLKGSKYTLLKSKGGTPYLLVIKILNLKILILNFQLQCAFLKATSIQAYQMIDHNFAIDFSISACTVIKEQGNVEINKNLLIDRKIKNTFSFSFDYRFASQWDYSAVLCSHPLWKETQSSDINFCDWQN